MVLFLLIPLLLGSAAAFVASAASEAVSESSTETCFSDLFKEGKSEFKPIITPEISRFLRDLDSDESISYHERDIDVELFEIMEHHGRRIRELERILEDYL